MSGTQDVVIAAGVESMTRVPMGLTAMLYVQDGLGGRQEPGPGSALSRRRVQPVHRRRDDGGEVRLLQGRARRYALESHQRAAAATQAGAFEDEIVPLAIETPEGEQSHRIDEGIRFDATLEGIAAVKLLQEGGGITAANASQICDGASGVLIVNEQALKALGLTPLARIHHLTVIGDDPVIMLEEPMFATDKALEARRAEASTTSTSTKSTRRSRRCRSPGSSRPAPIPTSSTSTAARSRSAIRSAPRARS